MHKHLTTEPVMEGHPLPRVARRHETPQPSQARLLVLALVFVTFVLDFTPAARTAVNDALRQFAASFHRP